MSEFDIALKTIGILVKTFQRNESHYKSAKYSEAQARKDFIDKFWIALGWDVNHDQQTNPYEQEVKVERGVAAGGSQRRADYAFSLAPNFHDVRFFVEAKKPSVDIATNENYFQLIRYGWNSNTALAVLTDFNQLNVLDCRYRPDKEAALNRTYKKFHYTDYTKREKLAEIYWLFSREAVATGSLEKRTKELPKPRGKAVQRGLFPGGYQSIDESFLAELDEYRSELARAFKNRNPKLNSETLTELTQRTLDRLVFLRFLEDKAIEPQNLVERFGEKGTAWQDFITASRRLDRIYNGIVYKQHDLLDDAKFRVDDDAFANICESIARINSPYDFNAIPIHILGSIYERFLGKIIIATAKRVRVEDKPQVRKAGGVYYTPEYIVRYIVDSTVGKLIAGKTPNQIAEMRFADIACGSGSFLLGVFDLLLKYHGRYYNDNPGKARKGACIKRNGKLYLSLSKKREILLNNIYGVDIDAQAVEVCQLSLYLKLLQEETEASTHQYLLDFEHTAKMKKLLPDLSKNIVCGNSLIGTDILDGQLFATDEERKLNPMNFEDAFPEVMKRGGFDAVIGNPPWAFTKYVDWGEPTKDYIHQNYLSNRNKSVKSLARQAGKINLFAIFTVKGISLLKKGGLFGYIIPNNILRTTVYDIVRQHILQNYAVRRIVDLKADVFAGVTAATIIVIIEANKPTTQHSIEIVDNKDTGKVNDANIAKLNQAECLNNPSYVIDIFSNQEIKSIITKADSKSMRLCDLVDVLNGIATEKDMAGILSQKTDANSKPILFGKDIARYHYKWSEKYVEYVREKLLRARDEKIFLVPEKLIMQRIGGILITAYDNQQYYTFNSVNNLLLKVDCKYSIKFLLGILNSKFLSFYYITRFTNKSSLTVNISKTFLDQLPIRAINFSNTADKARHDKIVTKVEAMMEAKKQLAKAQTDKDKTYYENKSASLDRRIDRLVYDLYGLTKDEIRIVEDTQE